MIKRDLIAENWRLERPRYDLIGNYCTACKKYSFPIRKLCIHCHSDENLQEYKFKPKGILIGWTKINDATTGFTDMSPLYYGIVELEHGIKVSCQLTSVDENKELKYKMPMQMVFRKLFDGGPEGVITYGFKAEPVYD